MNKLFKEELVTLHNKIVAILVSAQHPKMDGSERIDPRELSRMFGDYHFNKQIQIRDLEIALRTKEDRIKELEGEGRETLMSNIEEAINLLKIQGSEGNWNANEYMRGMYNGMELIIATIEDRDVVYKDPPTGKEGDTDE